MTPLAYMTKGGMPGDADGTAAARRAPGREALAGHPYVGFVRRYKTRTASFHRDTANPMAG